MLKVIEMDEVIARQTLMQTLREFSKRHRNLTRKFKHHYREALKIVGETLPELDEISEDKNC